MNQRNMAFLRSFRKLICFPEIKRDRHDIIRAKYSYKFMQPKLLYSALGLGTSLLLATPVMANSVLKNVEATGILTAGTSKDAFPYAYKNEDGALVGYSVDMLELIRAQLEKELQRPITLKLVALDSDQRIPSIESSKVDLVCDASSFTWDRDRRIDFSISYGITGTSLLVPIDSSISEPDSLINRRIGALPKTTNELAIRNLQPQAKIILFRDRASGYEALAKGDIDAFADDGVLLQAWLERQNAREAFKVASNTYSKEGIACMLPENNSQLERVVNYALIRYMQGFLSDKPAYQEIFDRWFGPDSVSPMTQDLRALTLETMELMLDLKEELPEDAL